MDNISIRLEHTPALLQLCGRLNCSKELIYDPLACLLRGRVSPLAEKVTPSPSTLIYSNSLPALVDSTPRTSTADEVLQLSARSRSAQPLEIQTVWYSNKIKLEGNPADIPNKLPSI